MNDTTKESTPTLAETLRVWKHELSAFAAVSETLKVAASMVPDDYRYENRADDYLRGYDDRQPEVDALTARVRELEAQLAERPQPAAVGVVGDVRWGVLSLDGSTIFQVNATREKAEEVGRRVVAIVEPDAFVPLTSTKPVAWRDDQWGEGFFTRSVAAQSNTTTVTPLYAGTPEPVQGEARRPIK